MVRLDRANDLARNKVERGNFFHKPKMAGLISSTMRVLIRSIVRTVSEMR